ncbi:hypothetical protein [Neolewinella antarctica]|uniref:Lipocalin-like domain-containing protein n=1 Tax=Neolewinella antarctica TaxID=442734 RepID=A0ABX0XGD5_9BACT|nr:hypothetical protein [Neolewinella antarctica]NJC28220.1 hypothetical protein [Neolewinella antarctica]
MKLLDLFFLLLLSFAIASCVNDEQPLVPIQPTPGMGGGVDTTGTGGGVDTTGTVGGVDTTGTGGGVDTTGTGGGVDTTGTGGGVDTTGTGDGSTATLVGIWNALSFDTDQTAVTTVNGFNSNSVTTTESTSVDYKLTFTDQTFLAEGGYAFSATTTITTPAGIPPTTFTGEFTNASSNGPYTTPTDSTLIFEGGAFSFDFDGMTNTGMGAEDQLANYRISGDTLTFVQKMIFDRDLPAGSGGGRIVSNIVSTSVWLRE